jgi:hypothetical protein
MGQFFVWLSHREPDSTKLTGFAGQFADGDISARISAFGLKPVATSNRQVAYRAMVEQLANAMLGTADNPISVTESAPASSDITAYQGGWPLRVLPARASSARVSGGGVEMTVYASVHGNPPDAFQIQVPMTPDDARQLAEDLSKVAGEAKTRMGR